MSSLVSVRGLDVTFRRPKDFPWSRAREVRAVRGVDLEIFEHETLGLVGESGSGKTTTGRALLHLVPIARGTIEIGVHRVHEFGRRAPASFRREVQAVFQDPIASLNPSMSVGAILAEPLELHGIGDGSENLDRSSELLEMVGLSREHLSRYPHEFSGGQRQRIAIARALATSPRLIVLDEPVSALDVSTQAGVMNLLEDVQTKTGVSFLLIAHDLAVVRQASHRIAVMYRGHVVEDGPADRVCEAPMHPYTRLLLASIPDPSPRRQVERRAERRRLSTGLAEMSVSLNGCPFASRCPIVTEICRFEPPHAIPVSGGGHVACHHAGPLG